MSGSESRAESLNFLSGRRQWSLISGQSDRELTTGHGSLIADSVVWSLFRDHHVVHVALAKSEIGDADEPGPTFQLANAAAPAIPHAGAESSGELRNHDLHASLVGTHAFNPLRDEFSFG